jgi:hypothetical protein
MRPDPDAVAQATGAPAERVMELARLGAQVA